MSKKHVWDAWVGEVITQIYTDENTGVITIVIENGRGATFKATGKYFTTKDPYAEVQI